ncbi:hypothetical protein N7467_005993 [Penicillium canescens]|nr:hypothetical protein N7467_005993 [Penicillium canescens]
MGPGVNIGWFGDPIFLGKDYPAPMKEYLGARLPSFTPEDLELLKATCSINAFYGMNHYSTKFARQLTTPPAEDDWTRNIEESPVNSKGEEIGPASSMPWLRIAPGGFRKLLNWVWNRYHLPILVTENGFPCPGEADVKVAMDDHFTGECRQAVKETRRLFRRYIATHNDEDWEVYKLARN